MLVALPFLTGRSLESAAIQLRLSAPCRVCSMWWPEMALRRSTSGLRTRSEPG